MIKANSPVPTAQEESRLNRIGSRLREIHNTATVALERLTKVTDETFGSTPEPQIPTSGIRPESVAALDRIDDVIDALFSVLHRTHDKLSTLERL